jgi:GLPGLI family protein
MKNIIYILVHFLLIESYSQTVFVEYEQQNQSGDPVFHSLFASDNNSLFKWNELDAKGYNNNQFMYKNKLKNILYDYASGMAKFYFVEDSLFTMKWQLRADTIHILNRKCFAAETNFRGRSFIAYYTTDIAISDGPWKFVGLPGLILEVKSIDGFVKWTARKIIDNYKGYVEPANLGKNEYLTWPAYVDAYKKDALKFVSYMSSKEKVDAGTKRQMKIELIEVFFPELQTGKGIEY